MFAVIGNKWSLLCLSSAVRTGRKRRNVSRSTFSSVIFRQKACFSRRPRLQNFKIDAIFLHIFLSLFKKGSTKMSRVVIIFFIIILRKGILHLRCIYKGSSASGELLMQVCGWKHLTVDELLWSDRMNPRSYVPERRPLYRLFRWIITHTLGTSRAVQTMKSVISSKIFHLCSFHINGNVSCLFCHRLSSQKVCLQSHRMQA